MGARQSGAAGNLGVRRLRAALLRWYDENRRPLAWRRSKDPYRIWVAEVMLQQTRVAAVEPIYRRFLRVFPTLRALARASEDDVLAQWSGLGYYRRASALHRAARQLRAAGASSFPDDLAAALALPGVGEYTAAAVLSIAYGKPHAAVDGNVARVLSRLHCIGPREARGAGLRELARCYLDRSRPGDWNESLMELGETICLAKSPLCGQCPIAGDCQARARGAVERYPSPKMRRPSERRAIELTVVHDREARVLLERGAFSCLPRMWLPIVTELPRRDAQRGSPHFRHAIQHWSLDVFVVAARVSSRATLRELQRCEGAVERRLFAPEELVKIVRSSLLDKALTVAAESVTGIGVGDPAARVRRAALESTNRPYRRRGAGDMPPRRGRRG